MNNFNLYRDIVERTNGDIYLGVVGPVRVGKSTFITKFMQNLVIPNIVQASTKAQVIDELPQSADGKTIMTTQPRFVPNQSVHIKLDNLVDANIRLIDCVGYLVNDALGADENGTPRMVKTPWSDEEMPLAQAAELGTKKVIAEHSTIAVAITTDGSFGQINREQFIDSEEKIIQELQQCQKPFVVILNSVHPFDNETISLASELSQKYATKVLPMNVETLSNNDINNIFVNILEEFPLTRIDIKMPLWMQALDYEHPLIKEVINEILTNQTSDKIGEFSDKKLFTNSENFEELSANSIQMGQGSMSYELKPKQSLFYSILSDKCGMEIKNDFHLISIISELVKAKLQYDKFADALISVEENGYGIVNPKFEDLELDEPTLVKQGSRYGVKIRATAPSLHIMKVDLETELNTIVGTQNQTEDFIKYLQSEYEDDPAKIWKTNMFGRTLDELIETNLQNKLNGMPLDAQKKMRKTLAKIVNEGKGGIICILL